MNPWGTCGKNWAWTLTIWKIRLLLKSKKLWRKSKYTWIWKRFSVSASTTIRGIRRHVHFWSSKTSGNRKNLEKGMKKKNISHFTNKYRITKQYLHHEYIIRNKRGTTTDVSVEENSPTFEDVFGLVVNRILNRNQTLNKRLYAHDLMKTSKDLNKFVGEYSKVIKIKNKKIILNVASRKGCTTNRI